MITGLSTISLILGTAIAYMARGHPERQAVLETVGGILLIGGFGLMGYMLETVLGHPNRRGFRLKVYFSSDSPRTPVTVIPFAG